MSVVTNDDSIFVYEMTIPEMTIPEMTAKLSLRKEEVVAKIEGHIGRALSEEQGRAVWSSIKKSNNWYGIFPGYAEEFGIHVYGDNDQLYNECFEEGAKKAVQESIDGTFSDLWDNLLEKALAEAVETIDQEGEEISWENIESQTKTRIQDENVKNGDARCARELKETSIKKWRKHYIGSNIIGSIPGGKKKDDLIAHILAFFDTK